jgi:hypothetical protein
MKLGRIQSSGSRLDFYFKDIYQFRQALSRLHIMQVRNFHYHTNTPYMIIVWCKEEKTNKYKCQLYMSDVNIKHENTFWVKKMHLEHFSATESSST